MEIPDPSWKTNGDDDGQNRICGIICCDEEYDRENKEYDIEIEDEEVYAPKRSWTSEKVVIDLDKIREEQITRNRLRRGESR